MSLSTPNLVEVVRTNVVSRTGRRVRDLSVRVDAGAVVLRGRAASFHVKQLALHGVREVLPDAPLLNEIVVA